MGVAPGIHTEFWEFKNKDFCGDLHNWTTVLLAAEAPPLVTSVSYGWQGNLTELWCLDTDMQVVDDNFAKLAARGITITVASGDSGSGYVVPRCDASSGIAGVEITAGGGSTHYSTPAIQCCDICTQTNGQGWTWNAPTGSSEPSPTDLPPPTVRFPDAISGPYNTIAYNTIAPTDFSFKDALFHAAFPIPGGDFPMRDSYVLNGDLTAGGGNIKVHSDNSSFPDTTIGFGPGYRPSKGSTERYYNTSLTPKGKEISGRAVFFQMSTGQHECIEIVWYKDAAHLEEVGFWSRGPNPPPPPPSGSCTVWKTVSAHGKAANPSTVSGGPVIKPAGATAPLWPSWPASSPWVTAVGATRFVGQQIGNEEMASDQFGSGGGFSFQFPQAPDASWQSATVAKYLSTVDPSTLPHKDTYPPMGRATPDVSALGEGYQVVVDGKVEYVGGTSASCPAFAAMVSLINEARFAAGKKQMGFLNQFLYANADAFTDVTKGSNRIGRSGQLLSQGFNCSVGW
jgi:hypothetical protein